MKNKTSNELKKIISGAGVLSKKDFRSKMIKFQNPVPKKPNKFQ